MTHIHEKCGCGAEFEYDGASPNVAIRDFRKNHRCLQTMASTGASGGTYAATGLPDYSGGRRAATTQIFPVIL